MTALISPELVVLDADLGSDKAAVVHRLAGLVADAGRATGGEALAGDALAREAQAATGLPGGIAIPAAGDADHLTLLSALARALVRPDFVASLRAAGSAQDVVALVEEVVSP